MPYDVLLSNKSLGKVEEAEMFGVMMFVFSSVRYVWWSPAFLEMAEQLPADGKQWINSLFCSACRHSFCFTY